MNRQENIIEIDLVTNKTQQGKLVLPNETIKASATILANKILDYVNNGGNISKLKPSNVFGRKQ